MPGSIARAALALTLALVTLLAGCALVRGDLEAPDVRLAGLQLVELGLFEQEYIAALRLFNPNDMSLDVERITYTIRVADSDFAKGTTATSFVLPANGQEVVDVRIYTSLLGLARRAMAWKQGIPDALPYKITGELHLDSAFLGAIPFSYDGTVPVKEALQSMR